MFNLLFVLGLIVGFTARLFGGQVISISAGLVAGVILNEVVKYVVWLIK
jgi:hypothetical protein